MSYYTDTFTFSSMFTGDWWNDQPLPRGTASLHASLHGERQPLNLGLALEGLGGTAPCGLRHLHRPQDLQGPGEEGLEPSGG